MRRYPGLQASAYRHPLDAQAEAALRSLPGFDLLADQGLALLRQDPAEALLGRSLRCGPQQCVTPWQLLQDAAAALDLASVPTLLLQANPTPGLQVFDGSPPLLRVSSGALDLYEPEELQVALAVELGRIHCGHPGLLALARLAEQLATAVGDATLGIGELVRRSLAIAFREWQRAADFSADRAALLVCDDLSLWQRMLLRQLAGTSRYGQELSLDALARQARDWQPPAATDALGSLLGGSSGLVGAQPLERWRELQAWVDSGEFERLRGRGERSIEALDVEFTDERQQLQQELERLQAELQRRQQDAG